MRKLHILFHAKIKASDNNGHIHNAIDRLTPNTAVLIELANDGSTDLLVSFTQRVGDDDHNLGRD